MASAVGESRNVHSAGYPQPIPGHSPAEGWALRQCAPSNFAAGHELARAEGALVAKRQQAETGRLVNLTVPTVHAPVQQSQTSRINSG